MAHGTRFTHFRQPHTCGCGKLTTGSADDISTSLCGRCYEEAGWENTHGDNDHANHPDPENCPICNPTLLKEA
jgi:hypothetical protein